MLEDEADECSPFSSEAKKCLEIILRTLSSATRAQYDGENKCQPKSEGGNDDLSISSYVSIKSLGLKGFRKSFVGNKISDSFVVSLRLDKFRSPRFVGLNVRGEKSGA